MLDNSIVAIHHTSGNPPYSTQPPFHPPQTYPEYPFNSGDIDRSNAVYAAVREVFSLLNGDKEHYEKQRWNPLKNLIQPGDRVLIKPNLVKHENGLGLDPLSVVTHGSVIRAVIDYVVLALQGKGSILIGDAPLQATDVNEVLRVNGLAQVLSFYKQVPGLNIEFADFRLERAITQGSMVLKREELAGAIDGYIPVKLDKLSFLDGISDRHNRFRVTDYDRPAMTKHHNQEVNEYLIPRAVLQSDAVINLPKMKTHRKVGITLSLKNLVGINGHKDWLPHHTNFSVDEDGDEYLHPSVRKHMDTYLDERVDTTQLKLGKYALRAGRKIIKLSGKVVPFPDPYFEGSWWGNDTLWRTVLDLNRILLFANENGEIKDSQQRRYLTLLDGFLAGESEGPLEPTPRSCGLLVAGYSPAVVDSICAKLMGFDPQKIPVINHGLQSEWLTPTGHTINLVSNESHWTNANSWSRSDSLAFQPSRGWLHHIELP